jgi:hypothetical protein
VKTEKDYEEFLELLNKHKADLKLLFQKNNHLSGILSAGTGRS